MVGDNLLEQFRLTERQFGIYNLDRCTPVSIRDQIVRAVLLVDRLIRSERLLESSHLLVVGAGFAGVAAALSALQQGVKKVTIIDQKNVFFSLQANCTRRWLDPVQYDWPSPHWASGRWPTDGAGDALKTPFNLRAAIASDLVASIDNILQARIVSGELDFQNNSRLHKAPRWLNRQKCMVEIARIRPSLNEEVKNFTVSAIIFAAGFGRERTEIDNYIGPIFWEDDSFEAADFGIGNIKHDVLVSGAGDGALQDFIRLATGKPSAEAFFKPIFDHLHNADVLALHDLWHWEDQKERLREFAAPLTSDCETNQKLQEKYNSLIKNFRPESRLVIDRGCNEIMAKRAMKRVKIVTLHDHFVNCYPLNRVCAAIIIDYMKRRHSIEVHLKNRIIKSVKRIERSSIEAPRWGDRIEIEFIQGSQCADVDDHDAKGVRSNEKLTFQGLVVRHGIDRSNVVPESMPLQHRRPPLHLP